MALRADSSGLEVETTTRLVEAIAEVATSLDSGNGLATSLARAADALGQAYPFVLVFSPASVGAELLYGVANGQPLTFIDERPTTFEPRCEGMQPVAILSDDLRSIPAIRGCAQMGVVRVGRSRPELSPVVAVGLDDALVGRPDYDGLTRLVVRELGRATFAVNTDNGPAAHAPGEASVVVDRAVVLEAPVALCIVRGSQHRVALCNPRFDALIGRALMPGTPLLDGLPEHTAEPLRELLAAALRTGEHTSASEVPFGAPDGPTRFVNLSCAPSRTSEGTMIGATLGATDVTESVRARHDVERLVDLVQTGESRLRQLLRAAEAGTWELDIFSGRETCDERFRELVGLDPFAALPPELGHVHSEDRERVRAAEGMALDSLQSLLVEFRPAANPSRWIELRGEVAQGPDHRSARLCGIAVDVTARKNVEALAEQLLAATAQAKVALERLGEMVLQQIWTATPDGMLDYVNRRVTDYFGAEAESLLGDRWGAFVHPDDLGCAVDLWQQSLASGERYEVEFRLRGADGIYRWHLTRAAPFREPNGAISKWFGTNTDVDELRRIREELERRTSYEQHLIGIVSHDLRTPLHSMGLAAEVLERTPDLPESGRRAIATLKSSGARAIRLVRDILDFSSARTGRGIPVERRPSNLAAVLEPAVREVASAFKGRDVVVGFEGNLEGLWDGDRISQVVQNALTNALRYSPAGTAVHVRARGHEAEVDIEVTNSGPPIPPARLERLFEPMTRGETDSERGHHGAGLGLFIIREIVAAHGGVSRLTSDAATGTRLSVRLPRAPGTTLDSALPTTL